MARIVALDVGRKRTGIAVTDPMGIVANGLTTLPTHQVAEFLASYVAREKVDLVVIGYPKTVRGTDSESNQYITPVVNRIKKLLPDLPLERHDERFTTIMAHQAIRDAGAQRKQRQDKGLVDMVSASIILQSFLEAQHWKENNE